MERKTRVHAEEGRQELVITREFDLPLSLLFRAHAEPDLIEQWMGTKVLKLENRRHGGWAFETSDAEGNVVLRIHGTIHEFIPDRAITRTFEMENAGFGVQLEFLEFEKLTYETSKLSIHIVFRSVEVRDQLLMLPFEYGINMAHGRLQEIAAALR